MKDFYEIVKARFDALFLQLQSAGVIGQMHPEDAKIRLEQAIVNGKTQYTFDLKQENNQIDGVKEIALQRNDVFVPNFLGVFLAIRNTTTGVETLYPYAPVAPGGATPSVHAAGFTTDAAKAFYDGTLSWTFGNNVMISGMPMEEMQHVPEVQGAFVLNSSDAAVNEGIQSEWDILKYSKLLIPKYTIAGTRDHKIQINLPSSAASLSYPVTSGYEAKLVLLMSGYKIVGGCEYFEGKNWAGDAVGKW